MKTHLVLGLGIFAVLVNCQDDTPTVSVLNYDCRRSGYSTLCTANDGLCDTSTGQCLCANDTNTHFLCQTFTAASSCTPGCLNGGECSTEGCVCAEGYYGDDCSMPRAQVFCDEGRMLLNVLPYSGDNFQGVIAPLGREAITECQLTAVVPDQVYDAYVTDGEKLQGLNLEFLHTSESCGDAVAVTGGAGTDYTRQFVVRFNPTIVSSVDQILSGVCSPVQGTSDLSGSIADIAGTDVDTSGLDQVNIDGQNVESVTFLVVSSSGQPLTSQVNIGEPIVLLFSLAEESAFVDFKVSTCKANNTLDGDDVDFKEITFVINDCPNLDNLAMFNGGITKTPALNDSEVQTPATVDIPIKVFKFFGEPSMVAFTCSVTLCQEGQEEDCIMTTCNDTSYSSTSEDDTTSSNFTTPGDTESSTNSTVEPSDNSTDTTTDTEAKRRRKREATDRESLSSVIQVRDPYATEKEITKLKEDLEAKDCLEDSGVIALVALLSVAVGLLLLLSTLLLLRLIHRGAKVANYPRGYPGEIPVETMHIPRLEFNQGV